MASAKQSKVPKNTEKRRMQNRTAQQRHSKTSHILLGRETYNVKGQKKKERRSGPTTSEPASPYGDGRSITVESGIELSDILPTPEIRLATTDLGNSGIASSTTSPVLLQHPDLLDVQTVEYPQNSDLGSGDTFDFESEWRQHDDVFPFEMTPRHASLTPHITQTRPTSHQQPVQIETHALQDDNSPLPPVCTPKVLV
jgi:hypothetical protein